MRDVFARSILPTRSKVATRSSSEPSASSSSVAAEHPPSAAGRTARQSRSDETSRRAMDAPPRMQDVVQAPTRPDPAVFGDDRTYEADRWSLSVWSTGAREQLRVVVGDRLAPEAGEERRVGHPDREAVQVAEHR